MQKKRKKIKTVMVRKEGNVAHGDFTSPKDKYMDGYVKAVIAQANESYLQNVIRRVKEIYGKGKP